MTGKVSDFAALLGAGVDTANDLLEIVDMSEAGDARNKKITVAELKLALGVTTYTDEQVRDVIAAALVAGSNLTITNDDAGDTITIDAAGGGLDAEAVMDLIATMITAGTNVSVTYDDASDTLTIAASGGGGGSGDMLAANNLSDVSSKVAAKDNISVKGADIASASTTDLSTATGDLVTITGTTTITAFGTCAAGVERTLHFSGALTLTHNATSLILPTGANIVTAAGDTAIFKSRGSGNWRCVSYQRASGLAIGGLAPPASGDFSITLNSPTVSDGAGGMMITGTNALGVLRAKLKSLPGGDFSAIVKVSGRYIGGFNTGGLLFRDTAGKYLSLSIGAGTSNTPTIYLTQWSAHSTFNADAATLTFPTTSSSILPTFLKLDFNATTNALTAWWSYSNGPWVQLGSTNTYLGTVDAFGLCVNFNHTTAPLVFFESFKTA